ncbi:CobW/HypB/UreG, nucleotide-binding domain-containing protein [Gigaspora rosea]|uniref:CobW/HypB/UreG, nucleotide-binding domain-containing protein n=1 Tax=Gigaspora rosea TaxID=44941 RepID=A0A397U4M6_9GLOM|nr:CobW/HypB/UreG, nucleotide-binding domain-containing protein [Gigaspora rosea]
MQERQTNSIPVTVFTGFLGSGKTTIILSLLSRVPKGYKLCLLKNEFGDAEVDSELAKENNLEVQEIINGCLCCVLVGQMKSALIELKDKYNPDRIIIETSGSTFPAPISWQIREMSEDGFTLDSIITVIDCINFRGYEDTSYTAKMQAQYTDIILLNKHELVEERELDLVIDHINELNTDTPKIKCEGKNGVSPDLIFGIDTKLFSLATTEGGEKSFSELIDSQIQDHHSTEIDLIQVTVEMQQPNNYYENDSLQLDQVEGSLVEKTSDHKIDLPFPLMMQQFITFLESLPKDDIYRLKGLVRLIDGSEFMQNDTLTQTNNNQPAEVKKNNGQLYIINHAFGRYTITPIQRSHSLPNQNLLVKITVMGTNLRSYLHRIRTGLCVQDKHIICHFAYN